MEFDFDVASNAWMLNKIRKRALCYYRCQATCTTGKQCRREAVYDAIPSIYLCTAHIKLKPQNILNYWPSNTTTSGKSDNNNDNA